MEVFIEELRRQLNFKRVMTYVLIAVILSVFWTWFIVGGATVDFMQTKCYSNYKGRAAIQAAANDRKGTEGEMTEDKLQKGCDYFLDSLKGKDETSIVMNKNLLKYTVYADILVTQEYKLRNIKGESMKDLLHISKDAGRHFYENEDLYYRNYINNNAHNENEKSLALSMWNKVKKPYVYYSGFKEWSDGISHIMLFSFVLMIMTGIFAGPIIAKDKESGLDEIIKATAKGRKSLTAAKIIIPLIMASIIYLCGALIYILLLKHFLPRDALNTSLQVDGTNILPFTMNEVLSKMFILGWISILTIAAFTVFISSIAKKSSRAVQISVLTALGAIMLGVFININSKILNLIELILPGGAIFSYSQYMDLVKFPITTIMGKTVWMPSLCVVLSIIIFLLSITLAIVNYIRR
ncbi:ABC transporter permease [Haloimpatiens sp. FM7315]|uniref:ABC transporter permease n=1 Tax=Haloimpatiens sp. FM7315 TaxID=3298609 RepID=UPI0035A2B03F